MRPPAERQAPAAWMDDEQVICAARDAQKAATLILGYVGAGSQAAAFQHAEVAGLLAEALHAVICWTPDPNIETRELKGALEGFLP